MRFDGQTQPAMNIASVRILRMALGTALSMWFSQIVSWPLSFIAPVITMFMLALPIPALKLKSAVGFVLVIAVCSYGGLALLPFILNQRMVGIGLLTVALYHSFYFTARGGSPIIGAFATVGLAIVTAVGTVSIDAVLGVVNGLVTGAIVGIVFLYIAHAILPDSSARVEKAVGAPAKQETAKPDPEVARRSAWRSLLVVMPIIIWFLMSSASASYVAVLIKVSSMGQQAGLDQTKDAGKSLLISTFIGGVGAIIAWQVLSIWPSLIIYVLMIGLGGLVMGPKIFAGQGMHPNGATWSYGFLTMIVVLAPAVMDGQTGSSADAAFWSRLWMFVLATIYAVVAVFVFDTLWKPKKRSDKP
jgi:hypothetical protein